MSNIQIVNQGLERNLGIEKVGRIKYELGENRKNTLAKIAGDIHKAALVMGIGVDGEKSALTAMEALRKIQEVYPTAWVQDISKAIEMGSFGQIKLPDQLNTISALNIFQWYKELRVSHPQLIGELVNTNQEAEMSNEEKVRLSIQGFNLFINTQQKDELAQLVFYDRFVKMGVVSPTADDKNARTKAEIEKLINNIPLEILQDSNERRAANAFKAYYAQLEEPKQVAWNEWSENPIVEEAIRKVKKSLVKEALKFYDASELIDIYKVNISNEYKVAIS